MLSRIVLIVLLLAQPACRSLSTNNRRGLTLIGGASVIIGAWMIADGIECDTTASDHGCEDDGRILTIGVTMLVAGVLLTGTMLYLSATTPAPPLTP